MTASAAVFAILVALLLGAMIPGPSFVLVARNAISLSRRDGLATALGMGVGGIFFGSIALAGLYTLLVAVEWLYIALKIAGGVYLIFIASKIWRGASQPMSVDERHGDAHAQCKQIVLDWPHDATQQSEDGDLVRKHLRCIAAAASAALVLFRVASAGVRDRKRVVHDCRAVLFESSSA